MGVYINKWNNKTFENIYFSSYKQQLCMASMESSFAL